jgi:PAS domain S-box-containing protein
MASKKSIHHSTNFVQQKEVILPLAQSDMGGDSSDVRDRQLQFFFEYASDAMIVSGSEGQCLDANPAACALLGLSKTSLLQHKITDFFEPDVDATHLLEELQQKDLVVGRVQLLCAANVRDIEYSATASFVPHRYLFVMRDVTGQPEGYTTADDRQTTTSALQQMQETLHISQTNLATTQRLTQVGNWEFDNKTQTMRWSEELFHIFGYTPKQPEPTLAEHIDSIHPSDRDRWQHTVQQAFLTGEPYTIEFRIIRLDGTIRTVEARGEGVIDADGQVVKLFGTIQDVSDRKQLELSLRQQAERERLVGSITQRIHQSLNVSKILDTTVVEVRNLLQADRVLMYQFHPDFSGTVVVESVAPGWLSIFNQTIIDPCFSQEHTQKYQQGYVKAEVDIYNPNAHPCYIRLLAPLQVRALLTIPVFKGKTLWGLLIVHQCSASRQWQSWEISLIQQLAVQLGIALQQGALYQQMRQQVRQERALSQVIQAIRNSLDLNTIFSTAVIEIGQLLEADWGVISHYLPQSNRWHNVATYQANPDIADPLGTEVLDETGELAARLQQQDVVLIDSLSANQEFAYMSLASEFSGSWLLMPLQLGDRLWGAVGLVKSTPQTSWQNNDVSLLQTLVNQLAIAIQQSELYQQVQQLNTTLEEQVAVRTTQLCQAAEHEALLKRITDQVRDSLDEAQILRTAVRELALALHVQCCDAALYDAQHTTSTIFYDYTVNLPSAIGNSISMHGSPIHEQLLQGRCFQFCFLADASDNVREQIKPFATLAAPILDNQTVLGDLWLFKQSHDMFSDVEVRLVEQVANQCAIALRQSRLYQEVQTQVRELARLNSLKDDFLSTVSHELRAPMANIKMASQMLEILFESLNITDERVSRYFQILNDECQREIELINDLLDLSRLEMGRAELNRTIINLQHWFPHIAEPFLERAEQQHQQLTIDITPEVREILTDLSYLERIFTELLHNACKYTPPGERIVVSIQNSTDQNSTKQVHIQITNTGVQIPDEERDRIFEKFYRIPNNDPWKHGGTGLGLALVKKMADVMGISIQLGSTAGQTTFNLYIPIM